MKTELEKWVTKKLFLQEMPINSADDLSRQTVIEYGTLHGSASMEFFKNSQIDVYRKIWEFMTSRPYVMVNSTLEGVEFVRESEGRYAFLLEGALSEYHNSRYPCDTITIGNVEQWIFLKLSFCTVHTGAKIWIYPKIHILNMVI